MTMQASRRARREHRPRLDRQSPMLLVACAPDTIAELLEHGFEHPLTRRHIRGVDALAAKATLHRKSGLDALAETYERLAAMGEPVVREALRRLHLLAEAARA